MLDPKELIAFAVSQTVKWVAVLLLIAATVGGIVGFLISRFFR